MKTPEVKEGQEKVKRRSSAGQALPAATAGCSSKREGSARSDFGAYGTDELVSKRAVSTAVSTGNDSNRAPEHRGRSQSIDARNVNPGQQEVNRTSALLAPRLAPRLARKPEGRHAAGRSKTQQQQSLCVHGASATLNAARLPPRLPSQGRQPSARFSKYEDGQSVLQMSARVSKNRHPQSGRIVAATICPVEKPRGLMPCRSVEGAPRRVGPR